MAKKTSTKSAKAAKRSAKPSKQARPTAAQPASKTAPGVRRFWLFKSEADCYSIDDLAAAPKQTTFWDGVRNYQARNMLRDDVQVGDGVLFYHSNSDPLAIVGSMRVVHAGYPDHTAFDTSEQHYDEKSDPDAPTWYMVDVQFAEEFPKQITRDDLAANADTAGMVVMQRGSRLSIQPVTESQWIAVHRLAGVKPT